ncbi:MAG: branched-chain amino acid ABC transporter permease [Bryobacterales bacterium]|nr:branched-chain amino acid ABC transporter permease [Bryobacterales bacterium]MDE0336408.1 branched-chain amino acid ABC transporter permease [Caldilineaceae bacterium]
MTPYQEAVATNAVILAIAVIGLYITVASGQFSVMHGALMGVGAYAGGFAATVLGSSYLPSIMAGAAVAGLIGMAVAALGLNLRGLLLGIATLAIGQAIRVAFVNASYFGGSLGFGGVPIRTTFVFASSVLALLLLAIIFLKQTRAGLAVLAVGEDETAAASLGIPTRLVKVLAFGCGAALAGLAGGMRVHFIGLAVFSELGFQAEIQLLTFLVIGGMASPLGAALAAIGIKVIPEFLRVVTLDRFWILGLLLTAAIIIRPEGLMARRPLRWVSGEKTVSRWTRMKNKGPMDSLKERTECEDEKAAIQRHNNEGG